MQSIATLIVQSRIDELHAEAEANRLAKKARSSRGESRSRFAAGLQSLRSLLSDQAETQLSLPKLTDYPYRS